MTPADRAVLSLGSNLGDRLGHLAAALEVLDRAVGVVEVSDVYETDPVGSTSQPAYLNLVAVVATTDPETALLAAHLAEDARGRLRSKRWGPRTLDADVIAVGGRVQDDPRLTLPHPRAAERAFVLVPWLAADPEAELPGQGKVADLVEKLPAEDVAAVRSWDGPQ